VFSYEGKFATFIRKCSTYLVINTFLLICCLPVITMGTAITAAYHTLLENQIRDRGYVARTFFGAFKRNLKAGVLIWSICLILIALFSFDIDYFYQRMKEGYAYGLFYILFAILLLLLVLLILYMFAYMARFEDNVRTTVRNAAVMMLINPWQNIKLVLLLLVVVVGIYLQPLLILIFPILFLRMAINIYEKIFTRYMHKDDQEREQEKDRVFTDQ
jgi:uncharacterized membrane protein YesL